MIDYKVKIHRAIERYLELGKTKFVIYPFGDFGMLTKSILEQQYGVQDIVIIDNKLCNLSLGNTIRDISILERIDISKYGILLVSDAPSYYSSIRSDIQKYLKVEEFIDVFSPSMFWDDKVYYDAPFYEFPRLTALEMVAREIYRNKIEGDIAECGVYRGWFANYMSQVFPDRTLYLFDTFEGFDDRDIDEQEEKYSKSFRDKAMLSDTNVELVIKNIAYSSNCIVRKGYFPDTTTGLQDKRFAFVSLDTDLYKPIYEGLKFFYPRLMSGGYFFVDDLGHHELLGVRKAICDYCSENKIGYIPIYDGTDSTAIIVKP